MRANPVKQALAGAACGASGKTAAYLATDDSRAREYLGHGYRLMAFGIDQLMLQAALAQGIGAMRKQSEGRQ